MKKLFLRALLILIPFLYSVYVSSQPKKDRDCSTTCFSSEVVSVQSISETCFSYELKVSFSEACAHALSHFTVALPCGEISNLWNSENWAQEIGTDPTTGLSGFKIDDIADFGESSLRQFTVKFNLCAANETCASELRCWQPLVAYKASTCVNYETLKVSCKSLKASLEKSDASCHGAKDGSLSVVIEEGQEPFTYLWSDNSVTESINELPAGDYSVIVRDASGAEVTLEAVIEQPEKISLSGTTTAASCNGVADGSVYLIASGGTGVSTFVWSNGQETEDIQGLAPGQYTVTVTDERNCSAAANFTIGSAAKIDIAAAQVKPDCNDSNGSIDITASGGTAPYIFSWSNGETTEDLANASAGLYTVVVTDQSGCSQKASYFLKDNNTLSLRATTTATSCTDDASGAIDLTVTGGTAPYKYRWTNGQSTEDLSGLSSGSYTVTVEDSKGCTANADFMVSKNTFQVPRIVIQPTCHDDNDGSITLQEPIGGTGPFEYEWSTGHTGTSLTDLSPGVYSVTITDATGCTRTVSSSITNPSAISASAAVSNVACNAEGSYAVDLSVAGGTAPYSYEWSNGSTNQDQDGLQSGTYTVKITDASGCSISKEIVVELGSTTWLCAINDLPGMPVCGSENNSLSTSITDADSYTWAVVSSDGSWSISAADSPAIGFTAGGANSSATFTLTIVKEGCTQTCSKTISACTPDEDNEGEDPGSEDPDDEDPDGGEPGNEDPGDEDPGGDNPGGEEPGENPGDGGSQTCEECFYTEAKVIESSGTCRTYEMEVNTNGLCRHDLSHWTLAIPCGTINNYSNSEGWKMELGKDPTTGLYGLKVDDISHFGQEVDSFIIRFTICESSSCDLSLWNPTVAYKAGQCVGKETIQVFQTSSAIGMLSVYPNPFNETIHFEWNARQEQVSLEIIDQYGNTVSRTIQPTGKTDVHSITLESSALPKGIYYYRMTIDGKIYNGKISKR